MGAKGGPSAGPPADHDLRTAYALMQKGLYEQAAELLLAMRRGSAHANEQAGDTPYTYLLEAARTLCFTCQRHRAEAQWHQQAYQAADRQEKEVKQELTALFEQITPCEQRRTLLSQEQQIALSQPKRSPIPPQSADRVGLWRRLQALLAPKPASPPPAIKLTIPSDMGASQKSVVPQTISAPVLQPASAVEPPEPGAREIPSPSLAVYCLGPFRVYQDDQLITDWNGQKSRSILKYLLANHKTPVAKDILMDVFWPDADPEAARRNLHQAIYSLRQTLRHARPSFSHILFEGDCYLLDPRVQIWMDDQAFEEYAQAGRKLETEGKLEEAIAQYGMAESLFQGDYLEEDLYEDWPAARRQRLRGLYCELNDKLGSHYVQHAEYSTAIVLCHRVLAHDNCHEPAHRRLMWCYIAQGQRHLAARQYLTCVETLERELDLAPSKETEALYRHITSTR